MKCNQSKSLLIILLSILFASCDSGKPVYDVFGEDFEVAEIANQEKLNQISATDTTELVFEATIDEVCQMKGCWMTLESDQKVRVTFKDYGFFVPKDAGGQKVIIKGKAYRKTLSEDMAKHYAEDEGVPYDSTKVYNEIAVVAEGVKIEKSSAVKTL